MNENEQDFGTLRQFLKLISTRRDAHSRLADFRKAFGDDLNVLQTRYNRYLVKIVRDFQGGPR